MRKRIVSSLGNIASPSAGSQWIDLGQIATVEVTSEDPKFPIKSAFDDDSGPDWPASQKGEQQIRLIEIRFRQCGGRYNCTFWSQRSTACRNSPFDG